MANKKNIKSFWLIYFKTKNCYLFYDLKLFYTSMWQESLFKIILPMKLNILPSCLTVLQMHLTQNNSRWRKIPQTEYEILENFSNFIEKTGEYITQHIPEKQKVSRSNKLCASSKKSQTKVCSIFCWWRQEENGFRKLSEKDKTSSKKKIYLI